MSKNELTNRIAFPRPQPERIDLPKKGDPAQLSLLFAVASRRNLFEQALSYDSQGDVTRASELYARAIEAEQNTLEAYTNLGWIEYQRGDIQGAMDCYENALFLDPWSRPVHYNLACLYYGEGYEFGARMHFRLAAALGAEHHPSVYRYLGIVEAQLGNYEAGLHALTRFRHLRPDESHLVEAVIETVKRAVALDQEARKKPDVPG